MPADRRGRHRLLGGKKKKLFAGLIAGLLVLTAGGIGARKFFRMGRAHTREPETVLPKFEEPKPGPRSTRSDGFGVVLGKTTLAEVQSSIAARNLSCKDTSVRALMKESREAKAKAAASAPADVDATTSASANKVSPMEKNPWVRLSCEGTPSDAIKDRPRAIGTGRLLYTFDSPELPLRHVSYRRIHKDLAEAVADVNDARAAIVKDYGEPTATQGDLQTLEKLAPFKLTWTWTDLVLTVSAINYGERGIDVYEAIEVPLPVRPDAPVVKASK